MSVDGPNGRPVALAHRDRGECTDRETRDDGTGAQPEAAAPRARPATLTAVIGPHGATGDRVGDHPRNRRLGRDGNRDGPQRVEQARRHHRAGRGPQSLPGGGLLGHLGGTRLAAGDVRGRPLIGDQTQFTIGEGDDGVQAQVVLEECRHSATPVAPAGPSVVA